MVQDKPATPGAAGQGGGSKGKKRGKGRRGGDEDYGYGGRERNLTRPPDQEKLSETVGPSIVAPLRIS